MLVCPDCAVYNLPQKTGTCAACGWKSGQINGMDDFLSTADRKSGLFEGYSQNYEGLAQKNLEKSNIDRRFLRNQAKNLLRYIPDVKNKHVCDVGIGQGFFCEEALAAGAEKITAVDVAVSFLARFKEHEKVHPYIANAETLPFENTFDVLASTDVMEHVLNVGSFLYSVNRALKPGGLAALRVPFREGLLNYSPHRGYEYDFGHVRSFNKDLLRIYMRQAGFDQLTFHLDGFTLGTPQPWLYSTPRRKAFYHKIYHYLDKRLEHPADATLLPPKLARLVMRPVEIVVIGRKAVDVATELLNYQGANRT